MKIQLLCFCIYLSRFSLELHSRTADFCSLIQKQNWGIRKQSNFRSGRALPLEPKVGNCQGNSSIQPLFAKHIFLLRVGVGYKCTGWPQKMAQFLYALTSSNINRFSKLFHRHPLGMVTVKCTLAIVKLHKKTRTAHPWAEAYI